MSVLGTCDAGVWRPEFPKRWSRRGHRPWCPTLMSTHCGRGRTRWRLRELKTHLSDWRGRIGQFSERVYEDEILKKVEQVLVLGSWGNKLESFLICLLCDWVVLCVQERGLWFVFFVSTRRSEVGELSQWKNTHGNWGTKWRHEKDRVRVWTYSGCDTKKLLQWVDSVYVTSFHRSTIVVFKFWSMCGLTGICDRSWMIQV